MMIDAVTTITCFPGISVQYQNGWMAYWRRVRAARVSGYEFRQVREDMGDLVFRWGI
jgi:hypothetical protein